jgi:hypothetical protein
VPETPLVDSQDPFRASAGQPIGGTLDHSARQQVIALTSLIAIFIERGDDHSYSQLDRRPGLVDTTIAVRQAQKVPEQAVEVGV